MTRAEILSVAKPILFNTQMVRAVLDDRKTVTRRIIKYSCYAKPESTLDDFIGNSDPQLLVSCAPYQSGDILYVRETWAAFPVTQGGHLRGHDVYYYKADGELRPEAWRGKWHPSIHMPKEAARLFLHIKGVRVRRLQDITEEQICEEGVNIDFPQKKPPYLRLAYAKTRLKPEMRSAFVRLWDNMINAADLPLYGWAANPWVWVIEFERVLTGD